MPTLTITKSYADGATPTETDLDNIKNSLETFVNVTQIDYVNIQNSVVTTSLLTSLSVDETKLATNVAGSGLSGGAGNPLSVQVDGSTIEISSDNLRVKDGGITRKKQATLTTALSSSSSTFTSTSTTATDVVSVSFTASGNRPVKVVLVPDGSANACIIDNISGTTGSLKALRAAVALGSIPLQGSTYQDGTPGAFFWFDDTPAAGTYTYKVQAIADGTHTMRVEYVKLLVFEI